MQRLLQPLHRLPQDQDEQRDSAEWRPGKPLLPRTRPGPGLLTHQDSGTACWWTDYITINTINTKNTCDLCSVDHQLHVGDHQSPGANRGARVGPAARERYRDSRQPHPGGRRYVTMAYDPLLRYCTAAPAAEVLSRTSRTLQSGLSARHMY